MILSDRDILDGLDRGRIGVDPAPDGTQIQPASLDPRLGEDIYDVVDDEVTSGEQHTFESGKCYLAHTRERIELPNDIVGLFTGRSTVGRMFVSVHQTAGLIDPSFTGDIELEVVNLGPKDRTFDVGDRVAQIMFLELSSPSSGYDGQYQGQEGITGAGDVR